MLEACAGAWGPCRVLGPALGLSFLICAGVGQSDASWVHPCRARAHRGWLPLSRLNPRFPFPESVSHSVSGQVFIR